MFHWILNTPLESTGKKKQTQKNNRNKNNKTAVMSKQQITLNKTI